MTWLLIALFVVMLLTLAVLKARNASVSEKDFPYVAEKPLFTAAERAFFSVLDQAIGNEYRIFGKVRVADILSVKKGGGKGAFFRISAKHFDFVLCRPDDLRPVCVIELNDQSHVRSERKGRDEFLSNACQAAGLPLIWQPAQRSYVAADVLAKVRGVLSIRSNVTSTVETAKPTANADISEGHPTEVITHQPLAPTCPRCSSPMVRRIVKSGDKQGTEFWGCSTFPACRGMVSI